MWRERYHRRELTTPRSVRNALVYVLMNAKKHGQIRMGIDALSSAAWFDGFVERLPWPDGASPVRTPRTWLAGGRGPREAKPSARGCVGREQRVHHHAADVSGALQAEWQAAHDPQADLAAAFAEIAPDELRHAALGWMVHAWISTKLDDAARARVNAARAKAARDLIAQTPSVASAPSPRV